jgi:thiol-disulfide isomerase/thioredoxin
MRVSFKEAVAVAALIASGGGMLVMASAGDTTVLQSPERAPAQLAPEGKLPSLDGATAWLNSAPLTSQGLRGKVVLLQFWTYSCINWRRTLPYVRAWSDKYRDKGLVVIGVHTPEFEFEKDLDNVRQATKAMRVDYPVAIDSNYAVWHAFNNNYWPALYFVDADGRIRHHQFGEGDYEQSERIIQQLLAEAGAHNVGADLVAVDPRGFEAAADWQDLKSGETYLGYQRAQNFASPGGSVVNDGHVYVIPTGLKADHWALAGDWTIKPGAIVLKTAGGRIAYRFHARDMHLIMGPVARGTSVRFRVTIDGRPPGGAHGLDVDEQGNGVAAEQRMYQLIRQQRPIVDRQVEIEFLDSGVEAFDFTFG